MFDWEFRASSLLGDIKSVSAGNQTFDTDENSLNPVLSILTPGLGFRTGCRETGLFRLGVRPEFVLFPHVGQDNFNRDEIRNIGISNWVVPEFLVEYYKKNWAIGLAYKTYNLEAQGRFSDETNSNSVDLADLNTLSLYAKYNGFVLGYNFVNTSFNRPHNLISVDRGIPWLVGYSSFF